MTLKELIAGQTGTDEEVLAWCNEPSITRNKDYYATTRSLMGDLGPTMADIILSKLETVASSDSVLKRVVDMLSPSQGGINLGNPHTIAQIDALVVATVLTVEEGDALKSLGEEVVSPAVNAGLGVVKLGHIEEARV